MLGVLPTSALIHITLQTKFIEMKNFLGSDLNLQNIFL